MKKILSRTAIYFAVLLAFSMIISIPVVAASPVTVVGEINDDYQIVGRDGFIYEIADTEVGNELLKFIGSVAEVKGTVQNEAGLKVMYVISFEILGE